MTLTSFEFFLFFALSLLIYYAVPKRWQWACLLLFGVGFFVMSAAPVTGIYILITVTATFLCIATIEESKKAEKPEAGKAAVITGIIINVGILAALKYFNFFIDFYNKVARHSFLPEHYFTITWKAPIGLSFYTLQAIGFILDAYWGIAESHEKNPAKLALFITYYPQMTSGPIARYSDIAPQIYGEHKFNWKNLTFGLERILWGLFKKLVISSRLAVLVNTIYSDTITYNGFYVLFAAAMFMFELYTDFSGCMDIVIGVSECYGIILPENFERPFFSKSVQEFWQRWHITLGLWLKDYILYPIMRSPTHKKFTKIIKKYFGKKASKTIPSYLSMLCVWLLIGLWHGGDWKYILGMGLWFWAWIVAEQVMKKPIERLTSFLSIDVNAFSWHLLQVLKTFFAVSIGNIFFAADNLKQAVFIIRNAFRNTTGDAPWWNPWIFFDKSLFTLGLGEDDFRIAIMGLVVVLVVSLVQRKGGVREQLSRQNLAFRWLVVFLLITATLVYGQYGPGYDPAEFIYRGF